MSSSNIARALRARHPLEELRIRQVAYQSAAWPLSCVEVERLWETFSADRHAGDRWMPVNDASLEDFGNWLTGAK